MTIAVLGGLDRLKRAYEKKGKEMGVDIRVFSQRSPNMAQRLSQVNGMVIFTGTVAHRMVNEALKAAKQNSIPVERSHSSGMTSFSNSLQGFVGM
ncbi:MAG: DUF2325 domain-containing protein [Candidatus Nitrohelix vancouverensis]|uniref:DUF2325 domain-containing protein n=1 Tax=Candidatus Nitrohelix vancouverensis TaxID=2705534 RepID=A0A7T0G4G4_9BACT|nr:MAG: DUF2325 domain-containing protein [Candidatus Nitrohelix vancouverensis]